MLKVKKLQDLNKEDLEKQLVELKKELMRLNAQISTGTPPENPGMIRMARKSIATIHTYLTQKKKAAITEKPKAKLKKEDKKESHSKKTEVRKKR